MRTLRPALLLFNLTLAASLSAFTGADDIAGTCFNQDKDAKIEIAKCGDNYCGKIVWLKDPTYPAGSKLGTPGTPKLDNKNPDAARRKDPLVGLEIIKGFQFASGNVLEEWHNLRSRLRQDLQRQGHAGLGQPARSTRIHRCLDVRPHGEMDAC